MDEQTETRQYTAEDLRRMFEDANHERQQKIMDAQARFLKAVKWFHEVARENDLLRNGLAPWHDDYPVD